MMLKPLICLRERGGETVQRGKNMPAYASENAARVNAHKMPAAEREV